MFYVHNLSQYYYIYFKFNKLDKFCVQLNKKDYVMTVLLKDLTPIATKESLKDIIEEWVVNQLPVQPVSLVETDKGIEVVGEDEGTESHGYCFNDLFISYVVLHDVLEGMSLVSVHHEDAVYLYPTAGSSELRFFYADVNEATVVVGYDSKNTFLAVPKDGITTNTAILEYMDKQMEIAQYDAIAELTSLVDDSYISNTTYYALLTREERQCFVSLKIPEGA